MAVECLNFCSNYPKHLFFNYAYGVEVMVKGWVKKYGKGVLELLYQVTKAFLMGSPG
jgi:hypothetical protein